MKRLSLIMISIAVVLGMTQCKKNAEPVVPGGGNAGTVDITLNVGNGSKVVVNTETGAVTFESGDVIYVSDETQGYLGSLSYGGGGTFSGSITTPTEGEHLYFYFLGNQDISYDSDTHEISVDIIDQSSGLPVISCEKSTQAYTSGVTSYSAKLKNKCALVKFNVTTGSTRNIYFTGINNKVTFTMGSTEASYSQSGEGKIILNGTGSGDATEKWAILFPMEEGLSAGADGTAYSVDGCYKGSRPAIPAIIANGFNSTGIDMSVSTMLNPEGTIPGLFTVDASGTTVYFSQSNIKKVGARYEFYDHQYECSSTVGTDLLGWSNLSTTIGGVTFRMLTEAELNYILNSRTGMTVAGTSNARYTMGTVNIDGTGVNGLIIFPDGASISNSEATTWGTFNDCSNYTTKLTTVQWNALEDKGCVFLPAAGYYTEGITKAGGYVTGVGSVGSYWHNKNGYLNVFSSSGLIYDGYYGNGHQQNSFRLVNNG